MSESWWGQTVTSETFASLAEDATFMEIAKECAVMWTLGGKHGWDIVVPMLGVAYVKGVDIGIVRAKAELVFGLPVKDENLTSA